MELEAATTEGTPSAAKPEATRPPSRGRRRVLAVALLVLVVVVLALTATGLWLHGELEASLAQLDGSRTVAGLRALVTIERDALGVPTVHGDDRLDVARATGFLHAQERFFQMDLLRRRAAGELAELFGPAAVETDRRVRVHRFRHRAEKRLAELPAEQRRLLEAYAEGVQAGLEALGAPPFEYLATRTSPRPWRPEDSLLVVYTLHLDLHGDDGERDSTRGLIHDVLGPEMLAFLAPTGTAWDAPLVGEPLPAPPPPGEDVFSLRRDGVTPVRSSRDLADLPEPVLAGSNNWAVAGRLTPDGGALLANDMHLPLAVPNIWYRISLAYLGDGEAVRVTGVSVPGTPAVVVGSNGHVAWGFTSSRGDTLDLVVLEPAGEGAYRAPNGARPYERHAELIRVRGEDAIDMEVVETVWGPVIDRDHRGAERVLRWIAHDPEAADFDLVAFETAEDVEEAIGIAAGAGAPPQNFVVAGADGRIAWTVLGPIPIRFGHEGIRPRSWADGDRGWKGYVEPSDHPRIVQPANGRLWTANNRVAGGEILAMLGDGGYSSGARARQIRDGLLALESPTAEDMLAIQLDDRALFLERWRRLLLEILDEEATASDPRRRALARVVGEWDGRASVDAAGYRLVRGFHRFVRNGVFDRVTSACSEADERFRYGVILQSEGPLWNLVEARPDHFLPPGAESWHELLLDIVDEMLDYFGASAETLPGLSWGDRNRVDIRHPLSRAVPGLSAWLDMPPDPLPGDVDMPRFQAPRAGASQRMVVSPGREHEGFFHMPGGQSGHPLSPHYRAGHPAWVEGDPTPFLPGPTVHTLILEPEPGGRSGVDRP